MALRAVVLILPMTAALFLPGRINAFWATLSSILGLIAMGFCNLVSLHMEPLYVGLLTALLCFFIGYVVQQAQRCPNKKKTKKYPPINGCAISFFLGLHIRFSIILYSVFGDVNRLQIHTTSLFSSSEQCPSRIQRSNTSDCMFHSRYDESGIHLYLALFPRVGVSITKSIWPDAISSRIFGLDCETRDTDFAGIPAAARACTGTSSSQYFNAHVYHHFGKLHDICLILISYSNDNSSALLGRFHPHTFESFQKGLRERFCNAQAFSCGFHLRPQARIYTSKFFKRKYWHFYCKVRGLWVQSNTII